MAPQEHPGEEQPAPPAQDPTLHKIRPEDHGRVTELPKGLRSRYFRVSPSARCDNRIPMEVSARLDPNLGILAGVREHGTDKTRATPKQGETRACAVYTSGL